MFSAVASVVFRYGVVPSCASVSCRVEVSLSDLTSDSDDEFEAAIPEACAIIKLTNYYLSDHGALFTCLCL